MPAKEKCGFLDFPKEAKNEFNRNIKCVDKLTLRSEMVGRQKTYIVEVPMLKFVGEFHRGPDLKIILKAKWDTVKGTHYKRCEYNTDVEQAACEWLLDAITNGKCDIKNIEMEMIPFKKVTRQKSNVSVATLDINITDKNYEEGLLEWWIQRFKNGFGLLRINSTSEEAYHISEGFDIDKGHLQLKGRFVIPLVIFLQINAKQIMFEDTSESSIISKHYMVSILNNWINRVEKPKTITFVANFEETDIGEKVFELMDEHFFRDGVLPDTWWGTITDKNTDITFSHKGNTFEMKIYDSPE